MPFLALVRRADKYVEVCPDWGCSLTFFGFSRIRNKILVLMSCWCLPNHGIVEVGRDLEVIWLNIPLLK